MIILRLLYIYNTTNSKTSLLFENDKIYFTFQLFENIFIRLLGVLVYTNQPKNHIFKSDLCQLKTAETVLYF